MIDVLILLRCALGSLFKSKARLGAEVLVLRQQIHVLRRHAPRRPALTNLDRLLLVWLYRLVPATLHALAIIKPETVIRWHRRGFRAYWRWKAWPRGGRPQTPVEIRQLVREMSLANPLWGRAAGIRDRPTAPRSPWQNGHVESLIGSIRRECLDHIVVFGERHLRHVLAAYGPRLASGRHEHLKQGSAVDRPVKSRLFLVFVVEVLDEGAMFYALQPLPPRT
jgi:Integrase core domain